MCIEVNIQIVINKWSCIKRCSLFAFKIYPKSPAVGNKFPHTESLASNRTCRSAQYIFSTHLLTSASFSTWPWGLAVNSPKFQITGYEIISRLIAIYFTIISDWKPCKIQASVSTREAWKCCGKPLFRAGFPRTPNNCYYCAPCERKCWLTTPVRFLITRA